MQPHKPQTRILSLIEGYPSVFGGVDVEGSKAAVSEYMDREMRRRPGHWFLVGSRHRVAGGQQSTGSTVNRMRGRGFEAVELNAAIYARVPSADGVPIEALVTKRTPPTAADKLPELAADKFGWAKNEITDALATARAWLFPNEGMQAA